MALIPTFRLLIGVSIALLSSCQGRGAQTPEQAIMQQIQESHIEGNVPLSADFAAFMKRDLDAYFTEFYGKSAAVTWEFLREGATQSGVALTASTTCG